MGSDINYFYKAVKSRQWFSWATFRQHNFNFLFLNFNKTLAFQIKYRATTILGQHQLWISVLFLFSKNSDWLKKLHWVLQKDFKWCDALLKIKCSSQTISISDSTKPFLLKFLNLWNNKISKKKTFWENFPT